MSQSPLNEVIQVQTGCKVYTHSYGGGYLWVAEMLEKGRYLRLTDAKGFTRFSRLELGMVYHVGPDHSHCLKGAVPDVQRVNTI